MTDPVDAGPVPEGPDQQSADEWRPGARVRLAVYGVLAAVGILYLVLALGLPTFSETGPAAGFFPLVAVAMLLLCLGIDTVRILLDARSAGWRGGGTVGWKAFVVLGAILGYLLLVGVLGHLLTTLLLTGLLLRVLGSRPWWQIALASVLTAVLSDLLFTEVLGLSFPLGLLGIGVSAWI